MKLIKLKLVRNYITALASLLFCFLQPMIAESQTTPENALPVYLDKAINYGELRKFDTSFMYYDSSMLIARLLDDPSYLAFVKYNKGATFMSKPEFDSGLKLLNEARILAEKIDNDTITINSILNIGYILYRKGLTDTALYLYNKALKLSISNNCYREEGRAYSFQNILYKNTGDYENGLETAIKSLYIFEKLNDKQAQISTLINLGNMYEKLGNDDSAYSCYELTYKLSKKYNDPDNELTSMFNMAVIDFNKGVEYEEMGNEDSAMVLYERAENIYEQALKTSLENFDKSTVAESYNSLARVYIRIKKYSEAIKYAKEALKISKAIDDADQEIDAYILLGNCYFQTEDFLASEKNYLLCFDKARDSKQNETMMSVSRNLSLVYEEFNDYKKALEYFKIHLNYRDSLYSLEKEKLIQDHQTNFKILRLQDNQRIELLKKEKLRIQRNITLRISIFIIVTLSGLFILFWMRAKKNRVIAEQKIKQLEDEKKLMRARSVLIGQENERKRIAHDLHDGIGVLLSTASIQFSKVKVDPDDPETGDLFKRATKLLNEAGGEVRKISRNMMPGVLSKLGLRDAMEDLFESVNDIEGVNTILKINCSKERLPENTEIMIYRVVQELVNNTVKHAEASEITFEIDREKESMRIIYTDNGIGFDKKKVKKGKGLGLNGIRSRIDFLNGKLSLQTEKGKGTRYEIEIPLSA